MTEGEAMVSITCETLNKQRNSPEQRPRALNRDWVRSFSASNMDGILRLSPPLGARSTFSNPLRSQMAFIICRLIV